MADTPEAILAKFERAHQLLVELMQTEGRGRGRDSVFKKLVVDAKFRLYQATTLLARFRAVETRPRMANDHSVDRMDDLRLHGESFYYFAWRARQALERLSQIDCCVDLEFDPVGVRDVRNRMIEHPTKANGYFILAWRTECPEGLILDHRREDGPPLIDKGLYPNAEEFIDQLLRKLAACPYLQKGNTT